MTPITLIGNATRLDLRFTQAGKPVASFSLAVQDRVRQTDGSYIDGETAWWNCSVFGDQAERLVDAVGAAKSLRVVVVGNVKPRTWETKEGEKRTQLEVLCDEVAPSIRFGPKAGGSSKTVSPQANDPWATQSSEAPF